MAKVNGVLKVVKKNDYGFYSVKIDDTWYGTGSKKEPSVVTGDTVEGEFFLEKEKYKTITKDGLKKVSASSGAAPAAATTGGGTDWAAKDASIRYQSARKDALTLAGIPGVLSAVGLDKAKPADKMGIIEAFVDKKTAEYFEDIATFGAVTRVSAPGADPEAPASDESDDE